ncbi:AI-2E family transporter [Demequina litorisediminis]|uniref:Uncharacterized protein n=1 Tax=Demequina litorisediminis TaxID=1849022 RepID=A0ABQ6ICR9_9MICO|nr:AI-2E family transporter [Demequina litorisediminis]GMA35056.1 hypothetical protein GCM10025876_12600 [Demequina litorisediminis]
MLLISLFFALAIIPGVEALVKKFNMRRGAAVGIIFITAMVAVVLMVAFLIPAIVQFAEAVGTHFNEWMDQAQRLVERPCGRRGGGHHHRRGGHGPHASRGSGVG